MNQLEANGAIRMASLGRPFTMGMLYDSRKDTLVPGLTLWDNSTLRSALSSTEQVGTGFKIIAEDSLEEKANQLDIDASLKLSFMGGLVDVKGAAKYLDNRTSSMQQSRVSLKYWSTTRFDQLTMEQLGNIQHTDVFSKKIATHVVTGILYGADAFFVFDRKFNDSGSKRTVDGIMEVLVKKIPGISEIKGDAKVDLSQKDKEEANKLECTFHGDLRLPSNPTTFENAIEVYQQLPKLMQDDKAIPKTVWLHPLSEFNSQAVKIVHEISIGLVNEAQRVMEEMYELEIRTNDLINNNEVCSLFSELQHQLSTFKGKITEYKMLCSKKLNQLLPSIREGGKEESQLADFFKLKESSENPFSTHHLTTWIKAKQQEIKVLGTHLQAMQKIKTVKLAFEPGDLDAFVTDLKYDYVICFSFKLFANSDQFLQQMSEFLQTKANSTISVQSQSLWLKNRTLMTTMRGKVRQFTAFAEANEDREKIMFVVTDGNEMEHDDGAEIFLYENGLPDTFNPPCKPENLISSDDGVTFCSVKLAWSKPEYGLESVKYYTVSYGLKNSTHESWETKQTKGNETFLIVENLQAETVYQFKVRAECEIGHSKYSSLVQIATLSSPDDRLAILLSSDSTPVAHSQTESQKLVLFELPKKEIFNLSSKKIRKVEIGQPPILVVEEKVLMVVGATGAGKSTLINGMMNFIFGVEWKDDFRFKLIVDKVSTQTKSVTSEITAYTIHHMDGARIPYSLTIIDTPGFGDTSGIERDKEITEQIKEFFSLAGNSGISHLSGIGFVTQSALVRLTPTQQYIFDSILSVFGKDVAENIFVMVTFCDGQKPPVVTAIKDADIPCSEYFKFNNSALYADNCSEPGFIDDDNFDEMFWKMGVNSFKKFFVSFQKAKNVSLVMTKQVLTEREKLEAAVMGLQVQMSECLGKMEIIRQHKLVLIKYEAQITANQDFTFSIKTPYYETITLNKGTFVTNCLHCHTTCHFPCGIPDNDDKWCCAAMSGNSSSATCSVCDNHCHWSRHKNTGERFELRYKTEIQNNHDLKKKYDDASSGKSSYETMIDNSEHQLEEAHAKLHSLVEEARQCLKILGEIALKPNPLTQMDYIQLLIDSEKKLARDGWHDRVQYLEKSKDQAALMALINDDKDIDQRIKKEESEKKQGWNIRVEKLEQIRRIKHAVDENKARKKGLLKMVSGAVLDAGKAITSVFRKFTD